MTRNDILVRLQAVAADIFGADPASFRETTTAADVAKWDSLRHLIFISAVEQSFDIEFDIDAISDLTNVGALVDLIAAHTA